MRRSVAAVAGGVAVLAITAAAASALTLTGPQNPRYGAGTSALNCTMSFALETLTGGTGGAQITGFKVTPTGYNATQCAGQSVYLKVAVTDTSDPDVDVWYMSSTASAYVGDAAQTFTLGDSGTIFEEVTNTNHVPVKDIEDVEVGNATGLVTITGQTSGF